MNFREQFITNTLFEVTLSEHSTLIELKVTARDIPAILAAFSACRIIAVKDCGTIHIVKESLDAKKA